MFNVGDKVVCVDDVFDAETASYFLPLPKRGHVYCIRGVSSDVIRGSPVVWIVGIIGRLYIGGREHPLRATRFRKIDPQSLSQNIEKEAAFITALE